MTKALAATCENGVVKIGGVEIPEAVILSEGVGESSGVCYIDKGQVFYVASNATDLKTTIEKLVDVITKVGNIATAIGAGMTGPTTAPPPTLAADVIALNAVGTELNTLKGQLK
jgi:hypothetical protein